MMGATGVMGTWTALCQDQGGGDVAQLVIFGIIVAFFIVVNLVKKLREGQKQPHRTTVEQMRAERAEHVDQRDQAAEVNEFFQEIAGKKKQPPQIPAKGHAAPASKRKSLEQAAAGEGYEGAAPLRGVKLVEQVNEVQAHVGALKMEERSKAMSLEDVVEDKRLSPGARAVLLMEIMGAPRSARPYRSLTEEF